MSVLSRHRTIPSQRVDDDRVVGLDPTPSPMSSNVSTSGPSRAALLISTAAIITAAAVGATVYVLAQDDTAPLPTTTVGFSVNSEAQRDAAAAARGGQDAGAATTEAQRDAAAAARNASR